MDTFFNVNKGEEIPLLLKAKALCFHWWVDELDCSKSPRRVPTLKTFDEILKIYQDTTCFKHFVCILRPHNFMVDEHLEIGLSCRSNGDNTEYFIFVYVHNKFLPELVSTFNLKRRK